MEVDDRRVCCAVGVEDSTAGTAELVRAEGVGIKLNQ